MTPIDRTPADTSRVSRLGLLTVATCLVSVFAVMVLAFTDHEEAAVAVGVIGGALGAAGGIQVTVNVRR